LKRREQKAPKERVFVLFLKGVFGGKGKRVKMTETLKFDFYDFFLATTLSGKHITQKRPLSFLLRPHHLLLFPRGACLCLFLSLSLSVCFVRAGGKSHVPRKVRFW